MRRTATLVSCLILFLAATARAEDGAISLAEAQRFAERIESTIAAGDPAYFKRSVDLEAIFGRAIDGLNLNGEARDGAHDGFVRSDLVTRFTNEMMQGDYGLLRVRAVNGEPRPIFRFVHPGGMNYHELFLGRTQNGAIQIVDILVYLSGEPLSTSIRRSLLPLAKMSRGRTRKEDVAYLQSIPALQKMLGQFHNGDPIGAMATYRALPKLAQDDRNLLLMRLQFASQMLMAEIDDGTEYQAAFTRYQELYPDASNTDLLALDYHFLNEEWTKLAAAIDRLDRKVGGDPYLDQYRASLHIAQGDNETGAALLRKVIAAVPSIPDAYYAMLDMSAERGDFKAVTSLLKALHENTGILIPDFDGVDGYEAYAASPQHREWLSYVERTVSVPVDFGP